MAKAGTDGTFSVTGLGEGSYTVEASASSFSTSRRTGVKLAAGATENLTLALDISELAQRITVEGTVSLAAETAPSQNTLDAHSARSEISPEHIQNFASPIADYTELLNNAPGTWSVNPNGVGLGDSKTYIRGFKDGQYTMPADDIPFNHTNDPTHHSWAFFPSSSSPASTSTAAPVERPQSGQRTSAVPSVCCHAASPTRQISARPPLMARLIRECSPWIWTPDRSARARNPA